MLNLGEKFGLEYVAPTFDMYWLTIHKLLAYLYHPIPGLSAILAVWESLKKLFNRIVMYLPRRAALGDLSKNHIPCMIFVNHLFTPAGDSKYVLKLPDVFPPRTTGQIEARVNIPNVFATSDAIAIADILNALGQVGRHEGIEIVDPAAYWDKWDATIVCVGGSFKSAEVFRKCPDMGVALDGGTFRIASANLALTAINNQDFGIICKTTNPENGHEMWLVIGLGIRGTESAGFYFRNNLRKLGLVFGRSPFSLVVQTTISGGGRQARLRWHSEISKIAWLFHPIACWRFLRSKDL